MSAAVKLALPDDHGDRVNVRGVGEIAIRTRLALEEARFLLKLGMTSHLAAGVFRDDVLVAATSLSEADLARLSESARHRCALAVLRTWGLRRRWERMYGSDVALEERMRRILLAGIRHFAQPPMLGGIARALQSNQRFASVTSIQRQVEAMMKTVLAPMQRVADLVSKTLQPFRDLSKRLAELLRPVTQRINDLVRRPLLGSAVRFLEARQLGGITSSRPFDELLRARTDFSRIARAAGLRLSDVIEGTAVEPTTRDPTPVIEIPDAETLDVFFASERGDLTWRTGPFGWLLRIVPLGVGAVIHERIANSSETALAWAAERFARHELRHMLGSAIEALPCSDELRQRLADGVDLYVRGHYSSADTLLSAGVEGLLFEVAVIEGVLTDGHKRVRPGRPPGSKVKTASDGRVLSGLGFEVSEQAFLSGLSLGMNGHPPRHGKDPVMGSHNHAAAALLGLLLVMRHLGNDHRLPARALLGT